MPINPILRPWAWATLSPLRRLVSAVIAVIVAAGAVAGSFALVDQGNRCPAGYYRGALHECVGVSLGSYDFIPQLKAVDQDIARENAWVAEHSRQHVTVALLVPLTSADTPAVETVHAVEGAYVAQYRANHDANGEAPLVELALANPGTDSAQWRPAVAQLARLTRAPDNLRAVAGIAVSTAQTQGQVRGLADDGIPVAGGAIVADSLANTLADPARYPGLARVEPTNLEEATALAGYAAHSAKPDQTVLVADTDPDDEYTRTLASAFADDTSQEVLKFDSQAAPDGVSTVANDIAGDVGRICDNAQVKWIFFAGRQDALATFVNALSGYCGRDGRDFTILTGSAASHLVDPGQRIRSSDFSGGQITLDYVPIASPATWEDYPATGAGGQPSPQWSPNGYQEFSGTFHAWFGAGDDALVDGQAIVNYDAVLTAVAGIRMETGGGTGIPSLLQVRGAWPSLTGSHVVLGASGEICLDNQGNPWDKVIPVVDYGSGRVVAREYPASGGKPVTSPCNIPKNG